jgi:hypothetical protein
MQQCDRDWFVRGDILMRYLIAFLCIVAMGVVLMVGCANVGPVGTGGTGGIGGTGGCTGGRCDEVQEAKAFCHLAIDSCNVQAADVPQSAALCDAMGYDIFCGGGVCCAAGPAADCDGITCQMTPNLRARCNNFAHQCTLFCYDEECSFDCLGIAELMFCSVEE